ncbi:hypothetical protein M9980_11290 [Sphingomonas donggukensis]|uniref:Uncharacterized protein n=1 Tax=Sphingomonas donggukensis TaxID=2949093 RepID=A0ABY4TS87_9SPHN|nr:hypothetical protein [Sphingomonas donggukensis]URW75127.1 hypothetical protein M9980_11290 [Sphingomonas donggukensis]
MIRSWIMSGVSVAGVAGIGWGVMPGGEVYPLPVKEVEAKLRHMDLPSALSFDGSGSNNSVVIEGEPGKSVVWRITERGQTIGYVEAELDAVDDTHTRVDVDFEMSESGPHAQQAAFINRQELSRSVGKIALSEAVDSTLEDRAYNRDVVDGAITRYAMTHMDEVASFRSDLDRITDGAVSSASRGGYESWQAQRDAVRPEAGVREREYEAQRAMRQASAPMMDPTPPTERY